MLKNNKTQKIKEIHNQNDDDGHVCDGAERFQ